MTPVALDSVAVRESIRLHRPPVDIAGLIRRLAALRWAFLLCAVAPQVGAAEDAYRVKSSHPRILIADVKEMARRCDGPLAEDYRRVKQQADAAVKRGVVEGIANGWRVPEDILCCGLAYLVEREHGREHRPYADLILRQWGNGAIISNPKGSTFGYHAIAYDWIYDALSPQERKTFGDALGGWLRYFTGEPKITLKGGHWEYNQTWGPVHFNVMNARDAIAPKLMVALAIRDAGTKYEDDARSFLDSWNARIPAECIPAFNRMGGVWSESYGHGEYGPVLVIPYAFEAWRSATGQDLLGQVKSWGYPVEEPRWVAYTMMPHNDRTAWIDDGDGARPAGFAAAAPMLHDGLSQWFSDRGKEWGAPRWQRIACYDPSIPATPSSSLPLAYCLAGAGHVYMRSAWNDPNATWAFFGCGPQYAGHSRDDEGHFLISKRGALVSRQGGQGHNDTDYYSGGSLIYNIVTIYDPQEQFRRNKNNENDGGLVRHVYETNGLPRQRGRLTAFENNSRYTYAAADITAGYNSAKAREVTRQFLYLRGEKEFFVVFDRVEATRVEFRRHFFLHLPTEPTIRDTLTTWLSLPEADGDRGGERILSTGRSRMFLRTLLPAGAEIVRRGGQGQEAWGHPLEKTAQYNHTAPGRSKPPICPWRLEVGDPGDGSRTLFLHVFEIADEQATQPTEVRFVSPAGVDIGDRWQVRFEANGKLAGKVNGQDLAGGVQNAGQYQ